MSRRSAADKRILDTLTRVVATDDLNRTRCDLGTVPGEDVMPLTLAARAHGVEAWLAACAPRHDGAWSELAAQRPRFLAARARANEAARALGARLDSAGCSWAVLKGLPIAQTAYPRPDLRYAVDLDILISPQRFEEVVADLVADGYQLLDVNWPLLSDHIPGQLRLRSPNGTLVDLHWHLLNQPRARQRFDLSTAALLARAVRVAGTQLRTLAPVDQLLHTALHACLAGANRLLWLVDVDRLTRAPDLDWDAVEAAAARSRTALPLAVVLRRVQAILGLPPGPAAPRERLILRHPWLLLQRFVDAPSVLCLDPSRPSIAAAFARSTGTGDWPSQRTLARHGMDWLRSGAPRLRRHGAWLDPTSPFSALHPVSDDAARRAYFSRVRQTQ